MRIDRDDGVDAGSGPGRAESARRFCLPARRRRCRAGRTGRPAPDDGAVHAERSDTYRDEVRAVYRAYAIDQGCAEVEKIETDTVTPAMLRIEAEDPHRRLAGLDNRLKGKDRLAEKVAKSVDELGLSVDDAFGLVKDAIRYTFAIPTHGTRQGVYADCGRL